MADKNRDDKWDFYLRTLSSSSRDSNSANDPASDPSILQSVCLILFLQFSVWFPRKMEKISLRTSLSLSHSTLFSVFPFFFFLIGQVKKLYELCKAENSEDLVARVYPQINKLFHRAVASQSQSRTSNGLLLLVWLLFLPKLRCFRVYFFFQILLLILRFMIVMRCRNRKSINFGSNLDWFG